MKRIDDNSKRKIGKKLLIAGVICVAVALTFFTYNRITDYQASQFTSSVMVEIKDYIEKEKTDKKTGNSSVLFRNYNFMGYIIIPKLNLTLPVMSDWNYDKLNVSPCRYSGSVLTGDLVIAAHNYSSHFGNLYRLEKGDEVTFTDIEGQEYKYEVVLTDTLNPVEVNKMTSGEYAMSLFTCNWTGSARITIRCNRKY